jgi:hypothetical protein
VRVHRVLPTSCVEVPSDIPAIGGLSLTNARKTEVAVADSGVHDARSATAVMTKSLLALGARGRVPISSYERVRIAA